MCVFVVFVSCEHSIWIHVFSVIFSFLSFSVIPLRAEVALDFFQVSTWMEN